MKVSRALRRGWVVCKAAAGLHGVRHAEQGHDVPGLRAGCRAYGNCGLDALNKTINNKQTPKHKQITNSINNKQTPKHKQRKQIQ